MLFAGKNRVAAEKKIRIKTLGSDSEIFLAEGEISHLAANHFAPTNRPGATKAAFLTVKAVVSTHQEFKLCLTC